MILSTKSPFSKQSLSEIPRSLSMSRNSLLGFCINSSRLAVTSGKALGGEAAERATAACNTVANAGSMGCEWCISLFLSRINAAGIPLVLVGTIKAGMVQMLQKSPIMVMVVGLFYLC